MQRIIVIVCLALAILVSCQDKKEAPSKPAAKEKDSSTVKSVPAEIYFEEQCGQAVLKEICGAKTDIFVQSASPSAALAAALIEARKGGLKVEAIVGRQQRGSRSPIAASLANAGIPVYIDSRYAAGRDETMVIDNKTVMTGSFDCGKTGYGEKLAVMRSPKLASVCKDTFKDRIQHAKVYRAKPKAPAPAQRTVYKRKP